MATVVVQKRIRNAKISYSVHYKDPVTYKAIHYKNFKKSKEARKAAQDLRALIDTGRVAEVKKPKHRIRLLTFEEVADLKLQAWMERLNKKDLCKDTYEGYMWRVRVLNRTFGGRLLCEITEQDILDYQEKILREFSSATSNRSLFVIKQVFKRGLKLKAVYKDHAAGIKYLSEKEHERNNYLKPSELNRLVEVSQKTRAKHYLPALIYLGAEHGASKQEALSLKWRDINFDFDGQGLIRFKRTKNKKERTEYLMPRTRQALLDWKSHLNFMRHRKKIVAVENKFVFCRLNGTPIASFDAAWRQTRKLAGIDEFHFHDLRHTFCSSLLLSGSGLKDVKEMIGHTDLTMTDRYSHLTLLHKRGRQKSLAEYYENGDNIRQ